MSQFVARNGILAFNNSRVTGSLIVSGSSTTSFLVGTSDLFVSASGNIGIGTTSPTYKLDIQGTVRSINDAYLATTSGGVSVGTTSSPSSKYIRFGYPGGLQFEMNTGVITATVYTYNNYDFAINNNNSDIKMERISGNVLINSTGTGNVGIGTASPSSKLHISGSSSDVLLIASSSAGTALYVSGSGNVGIGTRTPLGLLHVNGGDSYFGAEANSIINMVFRRNAATVGSIGTYNGQLEFSGGSSLGAGHMVLTSTGNVGIGTTTPSSQLHALGANGLILERNAGGVFAQLGFPAATNQPTLGYYQRLDIGAVTSATFGGYAQTMTLSSTNNVGIGTTTPNARLDVSGSAIVSGSFTVTPSNAVELQVLSTGVKIGNAITDAHNVTGSLNINGNINGAEPIPAGAKLYLFYNY